MSNITGTLKNLCKISYERVEALKFGYKVICEEEKKTVKKVALKVVRNRAALSKTFRVLNSILISEFILFCLIALKAMNAVNETFLLAVFL